MVLPSGELDCGPSSPEGLVWWGFPRGGKVHVSGGLHAVGNEVHVGGGLVDDLHAVGDEVHGGGSLVRDLHAVGDEVQVGEVVSGGSYTGELNLACWFSSDCQAHGPGR